MRHKPNWFILPVSAGSEADGIVRDAHIAIGQAPGPSVVIENQPGAGGVVGTAAMTKSSPDGQTLSVGSNSHVISPSGLKSVPFDPLADITPIAIIGATPMALVVNPKVPAWDMKELVARLKANPGKYNKRRAGCRNSRPAYPSL